MHLVGRHDRVPINMHEYNLCSLVYDIFDYTGLNQPISFFSLFYMQSCSQPISFFFPLFFPPTSYIWATQPGFDSSLKNTFSCFFDFSLVLGMTELILKMTTQNVKC